MKGRVVLHDVAKRYGRWRPWVLHSVDLAIDPGCSLLVRGSNGSGKSTLLRLAAGLSEPTRGSIETADRVGYVPERLPSRCRCTAREYLAHAGRIRGLDGRLVARRSGDLLGQLGLVPGPDVPVETLSKGNRQKVVLAQAFLAPVDVLVLDEPESGLDDEATAALAGLIATAQSQGTAILLSAHDASVAPSPDRTCRLEEGLLVEGEDALSRAGSGHLTWITLAPGSGGGGAAKFDRLDGVMRVVEKGAGVSLLVERSTVSAVLLRALSEGWLVESVAPVRTGHVTE